MDSSFLLNRFLARTHTSLKICGVTAVEDAEKLADLKVEALGINFWERSKRYCSQEQAQAFSPALEGRILRVGVFVNASEDYVLECFEKNLIDVAQFHGDETEVFLSRFQRHHLPFIRAVNVHADGALPDLTPLTTRSLLLDAHAPGVYGGTGETIDWQMAAGVVQRYADYSILLAGGITPDNAREAVELVRPCAIDVASGAESAPGVKDFQKVKHLQDAVTY